VARVPGATRRAEDLEQNPILEIDHRQPARRACRLPVDGGCYNSIELYSHPTEVGDSRLWLTCGAFPAGSFGYPVGLVSPHVLGGISMAAFRGFLGVFRGFALRRAFWLALFGRFRFSRWADGFGGAFWLPVGIFLPLVPGGSWIADFRGFRGVFRAFSLRRAFWLALFGRFRIFVLDGELGRRFSRFSRGFSGFAPLWGSRGRFSGVFELLAWAARDVGTPLDGGSTGATPGHIDCGVGRSRPALPGGRFP
jgi:hypothetical protein